VNCNWNLNIVVLTKVMSRIIWERTWKFKSNYYLLWFVKLTLNEIKIIRSITEYLNKVVRFSEVKCHWYRLQIQKNDPRQQCRDMLMLLHKSENPQTFVHLYRAIKNESHLHWLIKQIDEYSDQSLVSLLQQRYISSTTGEYQYNPLIHSHRWYLADHGNGWLMLWTVSSFVCNIGVTWPNI